MRSSIFRFLNRSWCSHVTIAISAALVSVAVCDLVDISPCYPGELCPLMDINSTRPIAYCPPYGLCAHLKNSGVYTIPSSSRIRFGKGQIGAIRVDGQEGAYYQTCAAEKGADESSSGRTLRRKSGAFDRLSSLLGVGIVVSHSGGFVVVFESDTWENAKKVFEKKLSWEEGVKTRSIAPFSQVADCDFAAYIVSNGDKNWLEFDTGSQSEGKNVEDPGIGSAIILSEEGYNASRHYLGTRTGCPDRVHCHVEFDRRELRFLSS